jgi:acyl-CoA reductase-like NAD-dependent aldehyde dehydrogenase
MNPADESALPPVAWSRVSEVQEAIAKGRAAQPAWARLTLDQRAERAMALARRIVERRDEIGLILAQETGRSVVEAQMSEVVTAVSYVKGAIRAAEKALASETVQLPKLEHPGKKVIVETVPRGVIGIIAPWNYPLGNFMKSLYPALLSGNGVVLKPSEHTPRAGAWLKAQCVEIFPPGLVQLVQGAGDIGAALIEGGVDGIVFTGSVATGRRVSIMAAERLVPCSVELGGKDAAIVLADCDLERTAAGIAYWALHNAGQNCAGIERVYVEAAIAERFVARLTHVVKAVRVNADASGKSDAEIGPLQNPAQLALVERHVQDALSRGAKLLCGGARTGSGYGYQPTVLDGCDESMQVVHEETFGPVIAVIRVKDADEAIKRANDSKYGLNGSVWTRDLDKGAALARRLDVGIALVNNHAFTGIVAEAPWTGVRETGPGVAASRHSYPTFVRRRTVVIDKNSDPDPYWFPATPELGTLADAVAQMQLGSMSAALKALGALKKRVAAIRKLARGE